VLDAQERLLLNEGQLILDEAQFDALTDRGAWAKRANVEAERKARAAAAAPPVVVQLSLFDRWERLLWQFDRSFWKHRGRMTTSWAPTGRRPSVHGTGPNPMQPPQLKSNFIGVRGVSASAQQMPPRRLISEQMRGAALPTLAFTSPAANAEFIGIATK